VIGEAEHIMADFHRRLGKRRTQGRVPSREIQDRRHAKPDAALRFDQVQSLSLSSVCNIRAAARLPASSAISSSCMVACAHQANDQILAELQALYDHGYAGMSISSTTISSATRRTSARYCAAQSLAGRARLSFEFSTEASINIADDDELLQAMKTRTSSRFSSASRARIQRRSCR